MGRVFGNQTWDAFPAVDVREEDERYVLEAELPGRTESDVSVRVEESLLVIESVQPSDEQQKNEADATYKQRERRQRPFRRAFSLPKDVDRDAINAVFTNGLLVLTLGKLPEAKPREIKIERA
jgi:HSP20 family protein